MINQVPGRLWLKPTTPFELVHKTKPDSKIWFGIFSVGYFNNTVDNIESRSKFQAHTLDGIAGGRDDKSDAIIFYNPFPSSYYFPPGFCLNVSQFPITNFTYSLRFDVCLICGLLENKTDHIYDPFPSGTRVLIQHNDSLFWGTINNIPLPVSPIIQSDASPPSNISNGISQLSDIPDSPPYVILLDSDITAKKS